MTSSSPKRLPTIAVIKTLLLLWGGWFLTSSLQAAEADWVLEPVEYGAVLLLDEQGQTLLAHQAETALVPASAIKILTSLITAEQLGLGFRCRTEFYKDSQGRLGIKGFGDPYLISEEITLIAAALKARGETSFTGLQLDSSAFEVPPKAPGTTTTLNPYDALNGALAVNFNSLMLRRDRAGAVHSAEVETPLTPMAQQKGLALKPGFADRINLTDRPEEAPQYAGELFRALFERAGLAVHGPIQLGPLGGDFKPMLVHYNSRKLPVMLEGMLRYSNNYIANQLFLIAGAEASGWPAERFKALAAFRQAVQKRFAPRPEEFKLVEASGISRDNHATAQFMAQVLEAFKPHYQLLYPHKRLKGVYLKSGTLTGVYNFAGYFKTAKGLRSFVVFLNQPQNRRELVLKRLKAFSDSRP